MLNTELNVPTVSPEDAFAARLQQVFHPSDLALWDPLQSSYRSLWRLGRAPQPPRIVLPGGATGFRVFERKGAYV